jgi:hypothetical protein
MRVSIRVGGARHACHHHHEVRHTQDGRTHAAWRGGQGLNIRRMVELARIATYTGCSLTCRAYFSRALRCRHPARNRRSSYCQLPFVILGQPGKVLTGREASSHTRIRHAKRLGDAARGGTPAAAAHAHGRPRPTACAAHSRGAARARATPHEAVAAGVRRRAQRSPCGARRSSH